MPRNTEPVSEEDYAGQIRVRADFETYEAFFELSRGYYSHEHALRDLLRVAEENDHLLRSSHSEVELGLPESDTAPKWG